MSSSRQIQRTSLWVLVWFALTLLASAASPWIQPRILEVVCSTQGVIKVFIQDIEGGAPNAQGMECPQCLPSYGLPPPVAMATGHPIALQALLPSAATALPIHAQPLRPPARAPPIFS